MVTVIDQNCVQQYSPQMKQSGNIAQNLGLFNNGQAENTTFYR